MPATTCHLSTSHAQLCFKVEWSARSYSSNLFLLSQPSTPPNLLLLSQPSIPPNPLLHSPSTSLSTLSSSTALPPIRKGVNKWRDPLLPVQILDSWVKSKNFPDAEWEPDKKSVVIDGTTYTLMQFGKTHTSHMTIELISCICWMCLCHCLRGREDTA